MGNIRTSKPIYKNGFVMTFFVKDGIINYKIKVWNKTGSNQSLLEQGVLGDQDARQVFEKALQTFTTVRELEN
jgi:hypothetical protein